MSKRLIFRLALLLTASGASAATLDEALLEYPELPQSKAMAVSFSDEPIAVNAGGAASDVAAAVTALGECEHARQVAASNVPCEIFRLNETTPSSSADITAGTATPHPLFMWHYRNGSTRVDLVGSIHLLKAPLHPLPRQIESAFRKADHVVVEVDMVNTDPVAISKAFAEFAVLPDGSRLKQRLGEKHHALLSDELRRLDMWIEDVEHLKPIYVATQLSATRLATYGYSPFYGMEGHFLSRLGDKTVHELESVEQQLALLASPSMADQVEILVDTLDTLGEIEPTIAKMVKAWFLGDDDGLLQSFEQSIAGSDANRALLETLIYDRNLTLAAGIKELLDKPGSWFVLVGAGHLPGPRGIVAVLEAQGVSGHRVTSNDTE